jgi:hypothetical protein
LHTLAQMAGLGFSRSQAKVQAHHVGPEGVVITSEDHLHDLPRDTRSVMVKGDLASIHKHTLWLFPPCVEHASFEEVHDLEAALRALPTTLKTLDVVSTCTFDFEDFLLRFSRLQCLSVISPVLSAYALPASLQVLHLNVYDIDLGVDGDESDVCLEPYCHLRELVFAQECDFAVKGRLNLPPSLTALRLNDSFNGHIERVTGTRAM